jgi:hypothetical protein
MKEVILMVFLITSFDRAYSQKIEDPRILHFYRSEHVEILNRYALIFINDKLKMRMVSDSYDFMGPVRHHGEHPNQ